MSPPADGRPGLAVEVLPVGEGGLLLEVADLDGVLALADALRTAVASGGGAWAWVTDVVPAARTVLLATREGADLPALRTSALALAESVRPGSGPRPSGGRGPHRRRPRSRWPWSTTAPTSRRSRASPG